MKTVTKKIEVYEYNELDEKAKEKALSNWNEDNDFPFLQSMLNDECGQLLKEEEIVCTSNHPVCLYSLTNSQGDGLMFEGVFVWNGKTITIKHKGHYYHSYSKVIDFPEASEREYADFENKYQRICKKLEKIGYDLIEDEISEEHFIDECNANEWYFTKEGNIAE